MKTDLVLVFEGKSLEASYIKNILAENEITSLLKENLKGQLYPLFVNYGWIKPVKLFVETRNEKKAREIIDMLKEN